MKRNRTTVVLVTCSLAVLALAAATVTAQVPEKMNYQMILTNDLDEPLVDQAVTLVFRIYDAETNGTLRWSETHNTATNSIGVVSVVLGSVGSIPSADFVDALWLEVEVDAEILSPRRELTSAPYAFYAADSDGLGGLDADDYVTDLDLSQPGTINDGDNPVDWTRLKGVPAGFADGTDAEGGAGDGHSLDASDGDPVDVVLVDAQGQLIVDGALTGDDAVQLPEGVIGDLEILDEPSVASMQVAVTETLTHSVVTNLASESIFAPADGYVLAIGTAMVTAEHDAIPNTFSVTCSFTVSSSSFFFIGAPSYTITMDDDLPAGDYSDVVTVHGLFPVSGPGTHTLYFLTSAWYEKWLVGNRQLTLAYFPSAGGNVDTDPGTLAADGALKQSD